MLVYLDLVLMPHMFVLNEVNVRAKRESQRSNIKLRFKVIAYTL